VVDKSTDSILELLFKSLDARMRPEDVAQHVLDLLGDTLTSKQRNELHKAARSSLRRGVWQFSSMLQDFVRPKGPLRQSRKARELFEAAGELKAADCADPQKVEAFIRQIGPEIRKSFGSNDFKADRLNREERKSAGLELSRRRYNKLFRLLQRLEHKLATLRRELTIREFTLIGKSGLTSQLSRKDFSSNHHSAAFIAYYTARCKLRSQFTIRGQERPFDTVAESLFDQCKQEPGTNWWAIAHVFPHDAVIAKLTEEQKGELLGRWFAVMQEVAKLLKTIWEENTFRRDSMVVKKGDDSSTWNNTASAWNRARSNWDCPALCLKMESLLDEILPGKVLRLMAADVAAWHRATGGDLDADTKVWSVLPLPWEVLSGQTTCTRSLIEDTCRHHHVDARKKGWVSPHPPRTAVEFKPTPELVHGVSVSSPALAAVLRKAKWFSGKGGGARPADVGVRDIRVIRDEHGFVAGVEEDGESSAQ